MVVLDWVQQVFLWLFVTAVLARLQMVPEWWLLRGKFVKMLF
jgi:hypothetical protein